MGSDEDAPPASEVTGGLPGIRDKGTEVGTNLRRTLLRVLVAAAVTTSVIALNPIQAQAASGDIGHEDFSFGSGPGTSSPTADKPESKLWFAYNTWWADMWSVSANAHHIFKLNTATQVWADTGVAIDSRPKTQSTVVYDGNQVFIASHVTASSSSKAANGNPTYLYRYSYNGSIWTLDAGMPVTIQPYSVESLTIDEDGAGRIWAAYTRGSKVYVTATTGKGYDPTVSFATPWVPSVAGTNTQLSSDDIATVTATASGGIMVLWSNQKDGAVYYGVHAKGAPDTSFTGGPAIKGSKLADDHLNLKAMQSDAQGRIFAAVKTSLNDVSGASPSDPLIKLLVFTPATGDWADHTFSTVADSQTRPLVLLDASHNTIRMLATGPSTAGKVAYKGTIYEKVADLNNPSFPPGAGTPVIRDASSASMNNATSTRQPLTTASGEVVLASNSSTRTYWHQYASLASTGPTASFTATPTSGDVPLTVAFKDTSTGTPSTWAWDFGDGSSDVVQNPSHTYTAPGTYHATLTATNAQGKSTSTPVTVTVNGTAATASFSTDVTGGPAPLAVTFTNTSTNVTSYSWDFGDGSAAVTAQSPSHSYTTPGTYTATLTASGSGGSSVATQTITVAPAGGAGSVLYRVNAGGPAIAGSPGWTADTAAAPSAYTNAAAAYSAAETNTKPIDLSHVPAGTPAGLFASDRWDPSKGAAMQWNFPVPAPGAYTLNLYFTETDPAAYRNGLRKFGIEAEGVTLVDRQDIYSEVGKKAGLMKTFTVTVTDGALDVNFIRIQNDPLVSGLEVIGPN